MRWTVTDRTPAAGGLDTTPAGSVRADPAPSTPTSTPTLHVSDPRSATISLAEHPAVIATARALAELGARSGIQELPPGLRTPAEIAEHLGVATAAVATTALLSTDPVPGRGEPILVVASAVHDLFPPTLAAILGLSTVDVVGDAEVLRCSGAVLGSASPIGLTDTLATYIDVALAPHPAIWVPAGHPHAVFRTRYDELLRLTGGHPVEIG